MLKKIAELKVNKHADYCNNLVKCLQSNGFCVIEELNSIPDCYYIIAKEQEDDDNKDNFDQIYAEEIKNNTWQERCEIGE